MAVLSDKIIKALNTAGPAEGKAQLGTKLEEALEASFPSGSVVPVEIGLAEGTIIVGQSTGYGGAVAPGGDVVMNDSGSFTIGASKITAAKLSAASIAASVTGDVTITSGMVTAIGANKVTGAMISGSSITGDVLISGGVTSIGSGKILPGLMSETAFAGDVTLSGGQTVIGANKVTAAMISGTSLAGAVTGDVTIDASKITAIGANKITAGMISTTQFTGDVTVNGSGVTAIGANKIIAGMISTSSISLLSPQATIASLGAVATITTSIATFSDINGVDCLPLISSEISNINIKVDDIIAKLKLAGVIASS